MVDDEGNIAYAIPARVDVNIALDLHALVNVTVKMMSTEPSTADDRASTKLYFKVTDVPCKAVFEVLICIFKLLST